MVAQVHVRPPGLRPQAPGGWCSKPQGASRPTTGSGMCRACACFSAFTLSLLLFSATHNE